jgi:hypothetical protein
MERDGGAGVACPLEDIDPTVFEALEGLDVVWRVGELNPPRCSVCHGLGLVGAARVSGRVSTNETWLPGLVGERSSVVERHAIFRVGQILRRKPPRNGVVFHSFQDKARSEWRSIAFHHLEMEAADWLYLA